MTGNEILNANVMDIIFENRNKAYGAYELRAHYNNRLSVSLLTTCCMILIASFLVSARPHPVAAGSPLSPLSDPVIVRIPNDPLPPILEPVVAKPVKARVAGEKFVNNFKIVPEETDFPEVDELATVAISNEQIDGSSSANNEASNAATYGLREC